MLTFSDNIVMKSKDVRTNKVYGNRFLGAVKSFNYLSGPMIFRNTVSFQYTMNIV